MGEIKRFIEKGEVNKAKSFLFDVIIQIKEYNYNKDLVKINNTDNEDMDEFLNGFMDVYISVFYLNENDLFDDHEGFLTGMDIFISYLFLNKHNIQQETHKSDSYMLGHQVGINVVSPILEYNNIMRGG